MNIKIAIALLCLALPAFAGVPVPTGQPVADYEDLGEAMKCFWPQPQQGVVIVRDAQTLAKLAGEASGSRACQGAQLPQIDFSKRTVIGLYTTGGGCKITYQRNVARNDQAKRLILYTVMLTEGLCEMAGTSMNWVSVPFVPEDYQVSGMTMRQHYPQSPAQPQAAPIE